MTTSRISGKSSDTRRSHKSMGWQKRREPTFGPEPPLTVLPLRGDLSIARAIRLRPGGCGEYDEVAVDG